jgi:hypothetical protein
MHMPPKERTIIPPVEGWRPHTSYVCDVAIRKNNPIHRAIVCSGFGEKSIKGLLGYGYVLSNSIEDGAIPVSRYHYVKAICEIVEMRTDVR